MADIKITDTIHYFITRPIEDVVDDGKGNYNISPLAFPIRNNSNFSDCELSSYIPCENNPTLIKPVFNAGSSVYEIITPNYISPVTSNKLYGQAVCEINVSGTYDATTQLYTFITTVSNNLVVGNTIICSNLSDSTNVIGWSGLYTIVNIIDDMEFVATKNISESTIKEILPSSRMYISYYTSDNEYISLMNQNDSYENGIYLVRIDNSWIRVSNGITKIITTYDINKDIQIESTGISQGYISLINQTNSTENSIYELYSINRNILNVSEKKYTFYEYDGTENDNISGCYNDSTLNHYRKSYSGDEVKDYINGKVGYEIESGRFLGSDYTYNQHGVFIQWFLNNGSINLSNSNNDYKIYIDCFGLGSFYNIYYDNTNNEQIQPFEYIYDTNEVLNRKNRLILENTLIYWGIGTTSSEDETSGIYPLVNNWPYINDDNKYMHNNITLNFDLKNSDSEYCMCGRHSIALYNDMITASDGRTVLKKTFIHLPAPLTIRDGAEFDIDISLPVINRDDAFVNGTIKDLSGYYSLISQPRAQVLSGIQSFATESYIAEDLLTITGNYISFNTVDYIKTDTGDLLSGYIRFKLISNKMIDFHYEYFGEITDGKYISAEGNFPILPTSRKYVKNTLYMSDIAYTSLIGDYIGQDGLTELNNEYIFGDSDLEGIGTSIYNQQFNTSYIIGSNSDKRVVLASVYPTATSTFAWKLNKRAKLKNLSMLLTNDCDYGESSILNWIYNKNQTIINKFNTVYNNGLSVDKLPLTYNNIDTVDGSTIIQKLRIALPETLTSDSIYDYTYSSFTTQAKRAYKMLINDFQNTRHGFSNNGEIVDSKNNYAYNTTAHSEDLPSNVNDFADLIETDTNNILSASGDISEEMGYITWLCKLQHLPNYAVFAEDDTFYINEDPFSNAIFDNIKTHHNTYTQNYDEYSTTLQNKNIAGDLSPDIYNGKAFARYSIIKELWENVSTDVYKFKDMMRYGDSIEWFKDEIYRDATNLYQLTSDNNLSKPSDELFTPFAKIFSKDDFLFPIINYPTTIPEAESDIFELALSGSPLSLWKLKTSSEFCPYASINQYDESVSGDISNFIKTYVPAYGAEMPFRFYDSNKIVINNATGIDYTLKTKLIFNHSVKMYNDEFIINNTSIEPAYLNDNFMQNNTDDSNISANDYNMSFITFGNIEDNTFILDIGYSSAPYLISRDWIGKDMGNTYTRIHMSFIFSRKAGRWYTLDYRQTPTMYLTPAYGAESLSTQMKSCVYKNTNALFGENRVPIIYDENGKSNIEFNTYPQDKNGNTIYDYLWKNTLCNSVNNLYSAIYVPYYQHEALELNLGCIPFLYSSFPYDYNGNLNPEFNNSIDNCTSNSILEKLLNCDHSIDAGGINFGVPYNVNGDVHSETSAYNANLWDVRFNIRPAITANYICDIPSITDRTNGYISDSTLYGQFEFPPRDSIQYNIPDPNDMSINVLNKALINETNQLLSTSDDFNIIYNE